MRWILGLIVALGGCRGDPQRCEQACRNFSRLVDEKLVDADAEVVAAPPGLRDALRKRKLEGHVQICIQRCVSINDTGTVDCMIAAKAPEQAMACKK
ncbi:MAG TPA: hypothetical protein VF469_37645 [Kofleriaceae bacterium]